MLSAVVVALSVRLCLRLNTSPSLAQLLTTCTLHQVAIDPPAGKAYYYRSAKIALLEPRSFVVWLFSHYDPFDYFGLSGCATFYLLYSLHSRTLLTQLNLVTASCRH